MALLFECSELWGAASIHHHDPKIQVERNLIYVPYCPTLPWGLFHEDLSVVSASVDFREGIHTQPDQRLAEAPIIDGSPSASPDLNYFYGGRINTHYGHFLINTLPRFWAIAKLRSPSTKILCHGPGTPQEWFKLPFIAEIFTGLGLTPDDFVVFDQPTRVIATVIPNTSFEEQRAGYAAYRRMCEALGERVARYHSPSDANRPLYFSKTQLPSAVGAIINEADIEQELRRSGVEIAYPEALSFSDQVRLISSRNNIIGTSGSFLHTSIFCPPKNIVCLNVTRQINSNYIIIDQLSGSRAKYYYPPHLEVVGKTEQIMTARYLPEAASTARELLGFL